MDTYSVTAPQLARRLGVSLPRVHRLLDADGVAPAAGHGNKRQVDRDAAARLLKRIGSVPRRVAGFDRVDMLVLAAVSRAGLGLESARAVARSAGVSPTTASKSLLLLEDQGLIERRQRRIVQGKPRTVDLWRSTLTGSEWTPEITEAISRVVLPESGPERPLRRPRRVPARFTHLFWNADLARLDPVRDSDFVAARLMAADDPDAWAWARSNLPKNSLCKAATLRGVTPRRRALIENLLSASAR